MLRMLRTTGGFYVTASVLLGFMLVAGASLLPNRTAPLAAAAILPDTVVARLYDGTEFPPDVRTALSAHRAAPADPDLALAAARALVAEGRRRGESRIVGAAQGILRPFMDSAPAPMLRVAADARQYQHDFAGALALLDRLLTQDPRDVDALLMRSTLHTVRGNYAAAREDCARLAALGLPAVAFLCTATTHVTTAEGPGWAARIDAALARNGALDPALHPWALGLMAEIARHRGETDRAVDLLHRVLALNPDAEREKLILADLLLAQGHAAQALAALQDSPPTDGVLLRRALAFRATGNPEAQSLTRMLDQRFRLNIDLGLNAHAREEAMFFLWLAPDAPLALTRAQANWNLQHEAEDMALLLAAATAAAQPDAARPVQDWMATNGVTPPAPYSPANIPGQP